MARQAANTETGTWRAASYARLSREDQVGGESDSIQSQRKLIDDWALDRGGVQIVARYFDDGWSGATFERPGFRQMIEDARRGLFDTIVVKDLSRFGRSYLDCGSWIERELPQMGVRLYSIADDFDSMKSWDYNMALLLPMKNLMNEMLVITTSEKVRTSLDAKRRRGECVSNFAPYGYMKDPDDPHRLAVDEGAAANVRRIFAWRADGRSAREIARMLNAEHVPCPTERKHEQGLRYQNCFCGDEKPRWHAKTVLRILRDETYTGTLVQGKTRKPNWRASAGVPIPREQWHRHEQAHEAIVERETFDKVSELLGTRLADGSPNEFTVPFYGHVYCAGCGAEMVRISVMSRGKRYAYYTCSTHRRNTRACSPHSIREEALIGLAEEMQADGKITVTADGKIELVGLD